MRVCFVIEGSYPYITGGVSSWVHDLIQGLGEIDFVLWTISPDSKTPLRYTLPENVIEHRNIVLTQPTQTRRKKKEPRIPRVKKSMLIREIIRAHGKMAKGEPQPLKSLIEAIPEGSNQLSNAIRYPQIWNFITHHNQKNNPIYPFSDYFWAWKSAHELIYTAFTSPAPEADVYHAVSTGFAGLAALCAKYRKGKPFILTEHGLYHKEREMEIRKSEFVRGYQRDMWIKTYNRMSKLCYTEADRITALFAENRMHQLEMGANPENTYVIPNGIPLDRFAVQRKPREGFHVGLVGRVVPIKDIKTFINAAKIILDTYSDATVHCIGPTDEDPGYYEDCQLLVESLGITDRFLFTGRQNVLEYYAFLDVLMLTSIREAQPLVILEAWCANVPAVATNVGNIGEMLDYNPHYLSPPKNPQKLAENVFYIREHAQEVAQTMEKNRKLLETVYSRDVLINRYRELYKDTLWQE